MSNRTLTGMLAVVAAAYVWLIVSVPSVPLQDYPNHLARAAVMADLMFHHGMRFGQIFTYHFLFTPYVLGDLALAGIVEVLGASVASSLWVIFVFLSLPCAVFAYLRARRASTDVTLLILLVSFYLSTDTFFVLGFLSFRLAVALVLFALAFAESLRRDWSLTRFAAFAALIVVAYLTHFAAVIFIAGTLGASALLRLVLRTTRLDREFYLFLPVACILAWHFLVASGFRQPQDLVAEPTAWGTVLGKITQLPWDFFRYYFTSDLVILLPLVACLLVSVPFASLKDRRAIMAPEVLEPLFLALAFLGLYVVMPAVYQEASFVDVRALAPLTLFFLVGMLSISKPDVTEAPRPNWLAVGSAVLLSVLNVVYLGNHFRADSRWIAAYRQIVATIPENSSVLPIYTTPHLGTTHFSLHAPSFATMDRAALEPYMFSADIGSPMKYFRYVHRPYAPGELWYVSKKKDVDWAQVATSYRFLLITKPYHADRITIATHVIAENSAAALLAIDAMPARSAPAE